MARGHLREKTVQKVALKWLETHYQKNGAYLSSASKEEAWVRKDKKLGSRGRADGLIVLKRIDGTIHTVSFEAKSSRLWATLTHSYRDDKWFIHACLVGLIFATVLLLVAWNDWSLLALVAGGIVAFLVTGIAYLFITQNHDWYRGINVVDQVKRYPANEKWVVISTDVHNRLDALQQKTLDRTCRENGIGLLRVSANEKVQIVLQPKPINVPKGYRDYLECYHAGKTVRAQLDKPANNL